MLADREMARRVVAAVEMRQGSTAQLEPMCRVAYTSFRKLWASWIAPRYRPENAF